MKNFKNVSKSKSAFEIAPNKGWKSGIVSNIIRSNKPNKCKEEGTYVF